MEKLTAFPSSRALSSIMFLNHFSLLYVSSLTLTVLSSFFPIFPPGKVFSGIFIYLHP
jgi:hypothetical protein